MRTARAKVVNGKIVTRAKFPEGTKLVLVVDEPKPPIVIDDDDVQAFDEAVAAVREGKTIPARRQRPCSPGSRAAPESPSRGRPGGASS